MILKATRTLKLVRVDQPGLASGEVRIEVRQCGVCDSDVRLWEGSNGPSFPLQVGHEFAGIVVEVGRGVRTLHRGDTVAVCVPTDSTLPASHGLRRGLGDEAVVEARHCVPIAPHVRFPFAAEPLGRVLATLEKAGPGPGSHAVVLGSSFKAMLAAILLSGGRDPARVLVASSRPGVQVLAMGLGVGEAVGPEDLLGAVGRRTRGRGSDIVYDFTGTQSGLELASRAVRQGGKLVVGRSQVMPPQAAVRHLEDQHVEVVRADLPNEASSLQGMAYAGDLLKRQVIDLAPLVRGQFPLERVTMAFEEAVYGGGRVLVGR